MLYLLTFLLVHLVFNKGQSKDLYSPKSGEYKKKKRNKLLPTCITNVTKT